MTYGATSPCAVVNVVTQADVKPGTPLNTVVPTITGTPEVGKLLIATPGTWDVAGLHFAYQWQVHGVNISGETRANFRSATSAAITVKFASATGLALSRTVLSPSQHTAATVKVTSGAAVLPAGTVEITLNGRSLASLPIAAGSSGAVTYRLPKQGSGVFTVRTTFVPTAADTVAGSTSPPKRYVVIF